MAIEKNDDLSHQYGIIRISIQYHKDVGMTSLWRQNGIQMLSNGSVRRFSVSAKPTSAAVEPTTKGEKDLLLRRVIGAALLSALAAVTCSSAFAMSDCESLLRKRDLARAYSACSAALISRQKSAKGGQKGDLEALARAHDDLGSLFMLRGQYAEAEAQYRESLAARQKALGRSHHLQAMSLLPLADALVFQAKIAEAEPLLQHALELRQRALGPHSEATAQAHHALGMLYTRLDAVKAESSFRDEITILERLYPSGSAATAIAYNNLGILRQREGNPDQAESYFRSAISMLERTAPKGAHKLEGPLLNLATVLTEKQQYSNAKPLLLRLLDIRKQLHGPESASVADIHNRLGVLHTRTGAVELAEAELRRAVTMREKNLGTNHLLVAESCANLGILLMQKGRLNEALPLLRHAAAVTHSSTGPQSAQTTAAWQNLEQLYGRIIKASVTN